MNISKTLIYCSLLCLLSSCATVFSGKNQLVDISIPTQGAKLTIDSLTISTGTNFKTLILKDYIAKQLKFDAEGYKTTYHTIVPGDRSKWTYLSYFPFAAVLFLPPIIDLVSLNTWVFKDEYAFSSMRKYVNSDSTKKQLFMRNVAFEVSNSNNLFKAYTYDDYISKGDSLRVMKYDSIGMKSTNMDVKLTDVLKKLSYIDTMNTVFIDNVNSIYLHANVTKVVFKGVTYPMAAMFNYYRFVDAELTTSWIAKNIYGDTLHKSTIVSLSGQFAVKNLVSTSAEKLAVEDAMEYSMLDFIDTLTSTGLAKSEKQITNFKEFISIGKPAKSPTNVSEAMKASVTIKDKEGHGSGFLISNDGYILTNHHVVKKNTDYTVILNDGTEYKAKVIRSNKAIDLALVKVEGNFELAYNLPETQNYKVGDEVWTIGTPQSVQLGQSVSKGIVSGSRKHNNSNYLQTDISVNKGNSGGPILLKNGELVAVVEYKLYGLGTEGISFSIPAYEVMQSLGIKY